MGELQKTGYSEQTSEKFMIDSATIYKNFGYASATKKFSGDLLGATDGGVEVDIELKYRDIKVDGTYWSPVKGNKALSSAEASAKASIKELDADRFRLAVNGTTRQALPTEAPDGYKIVEGKRYVEDTDYIDNIAIVGKLTGTEQPVIIVFDNCLVTGGIKMKTKDEDEATLDLELTAHASFTQLVGDEFPWRILYPQVGTAPTALAFNPVATAVKVGASVQAVVKATPAGANVPEGIYVSDKPAMAKVSRGGLITGVAVGTANVDFVALDGSLKATTVVTVTAP